MITWKRLPSVTTGGKPSFLVGRGKDNLYHVVWNRIDLRYHAQVDHKMIEMFDSEVVGRQFLDDYERRVAREHTTDNMSDKKGSD